MIFIPGLCQAAKQYQIGIFVALGTKLAKLFSFEIAFSRGADETIIADKNCSYRFPGSIRILPTHEAVFAQDSIPSNGVGVAQCSDHYRPIVLKL